MNSSGRLLQEAKANEFAVRSFYARFINQLADSLFAVFKIFITRIKLCVENNYPEQFIPDHCSSVHKPIISN
jgi:hypothetical protein